MDALGIPASTHPHLDRGVYVGTRHAQANVPLLKGAEIGNKIHSTQHTTQTSHVNKP